MSSYNRHKSEDAGDGISQYEKFYNQSWVGNDVSQGTGTFLTSRNRKNTYGVDIPNFHRRKREGELLPLTPFLQSTEWGYASEGARDYTKTFSGGSTTHYWTEGVYWPTHLAFDYMLTADYVLSVANEKISDDAVGWAAARIYSAGFDGLTFAAEFTKTVAMFRGLLKRWTKLALTGKLEKLWLEGRYGWRTLVYDMLEIQQLVEKLDDERKRFREHAGFSESWQSKDVINAGGSTVSYDAVSITSASLNHRATVVAEIEPPKVIMNPFITAWELMTLSFVIDWAIQIGRWLEAMSFLALSTKHYASKGVFVEYTKECFIENVSWASGYSGDLSCYGTSRCSVTLREPTSVPLKPTVNLQLNAFKVLDLVAILVGKVRR